MSHEPPVTKRQRIDLASSSSSPSSSSSSSNSIDNLNEHVVNEQAVDNEWLDALQTHRCLCDVPDPWKPFQRYMVRSGGGGNGGNNENDAIDDLDEWSADNILKFLSAIQLFFDVYLKQNRHGNICKKMVDAVNALINHHDSSINVIDDLLGLCDRQLQSKGADDTKFCLYLASKVISHYFVIVKQDAAQPWLNRIVNNLLNFESLNDLAIRKINFSLDVIRNIIEFKDIEVHPLDTVELLDSLPLPPIENNYFAQSFFANNPASSHQHQPGGRILFGESSSSNHSYSRNNSNNSNSCNNASNNHMPSNCQFVTLTDSDSFDTTNIKCTTMQILENKWPALVATMTTLIESQRINSYAESCTYTFLGLWQNIISVKANLSVVETMPFHVQLEGFSDLLEKRLSVNCYRHMLALFNEALCYASTLALQDLLPEETIKLSQRIIRLIKDSSLLENLPHAQNSFEGTTEFNGRSNTIEYEPHSFDVVRKQHITNDTKQYDCALMQKIFLLALKSVAVLVKESRSDSSSDSTFDSQDLEICAADMVIIEATIRAVLSKMERFIKREMEFHPNTHFSKILIHLFSDQDDYLIEAMVCSVDVITGITFQPNAFPQLLSMLNPVFTFLEFLKMIGNSHDLLLDLLISNETSFLLYLLRFLKYIRVNWTFFIQSCADPTVGGPSCLNDTMTVLIQLRLTISRLVAKGEFPYEIGPILRLLESCENLYEGQELS